MLAPRIEVTTFNADKYFQPLELACKSNVPRIVNSSLDCIQVCTVHVFTYSVVCTGCSVSVCHTHMLGGVM